MGTAQKRNAADEPSGKLSVAEVLRRTAGRYVQSHPKQAAPQVQSTLAKLSLCRTASLGGRRYCCSACERECIVYNSCGDRHCPQCSGAKRADWLESTSQLILDGVSHFQVVFTLPSDLSRLSLGNRRVIYDLLFASAWQALKQTIEQEQGYDPAALMVLHTWNQKLDAHAHVHAVVAGGGPSLDGDGWRWAVRGDDSAGRYLVDAVELRHRYREHFLRGLKRLHAADKLKLEGDFSCLRDDEAWASFMDNLKAAEWVIHIEPPPAANLGAAPVLKYLARYLTGGPISDSRIVSADEQEVTFMAREGKTPSGDSVQTPITMPTVEFTRRWSLHVLPKGYTKCRRFGGWSNTRRAAYIELGKDLLRQLDLPPAHEDSHGEPPSEPTDDAPRQCPQCGSPLILQEVHESPGWSVVMQSARRPIWYEPHDSR